MKPMYLRVGLCGIQSENQYTLYTMIPRQNLLCQRRAAWSCNSTMLTFLRSFLFVSRIHVSRIHVQETMLSRETSLTSKYWTVWIWVFASEAQECTRFDICQPEHHCPHTWIPNLFFGFVSLLDHLCHLTDYLLRVALSKRSTLPFCGYV